MRRSRAPSVFAMAADQRLRESRAVGGDGRCRRSPAGGDNLRALLPQQAHVDAVRKHSLRLAPEDPSEPA